MALVFDPATMSTGDARIDQEHGQLIDHINRLFAHMLQGKGADGLPPLLDFIERYALEHFSYEEDCFQRHRCPAHAANVAAHKQFVQVWKSFRANLDKQGPTTSLVLEAQRQLSDWLRNHICRTDVQLRPCLTGR